MSTVGVHCDGMSDSWSSLSQCNIALAESAGAHAIELGGPHKAVPPYITGGKEIGTWYHMHTFGGARAVQQLLLFSM